MSPLDKKIRVLHIITLFSVGGATETVISIAKGLMLRNYDITVVSGPFIESEGDMLPVAIEAGIKVIIIPELRRNIHPIHDIRAFYRLRKMIREGRYDVVHTHSSKAGIIGRLAAYYEGVQNIVHTIHGLPFHHYQNHFARLLYILVERFTAKRCSKLIAVSHKIIQESLNAGIGSTDQFEVVRSGFDVQPFINNSLKNSKLMTDLKIQDGDFVLGNISRLSPLKGHAILIDILPKLKKRIPQLKLLFIGDGKIRHSLEQKATAINLKESVIFAGSIPPSNIPQYLSLMDIVVHTSLHEGLARVLPQALVMGKPVVTYSLDGAPEVIQDGYNGYLVEALNKDELINSICDIFQQYKQFESRCLLDKGKIIHEFSEDKMVMETENTYKMLIENKLN
jgi:glycosyltransferase involved in cell wall biosynthesis